MPMVRSKESALKFLHHLVDISNNLKRLLDDINVKLGDIEELQRDDDIGLSLSKEQRVVLNSKQAYVSIKERIEFMKPETISNVKEMLDNCVESIFLEKKSDEKQVILEKKEKDRTMQKVQPGNVKFERYGKNFVMPTPENNEKAMITARGRPKEKEKVKMQKESNINEENVGVNHHEIMKDGENDIDNKIKEEALPKGRIPYAWRKGNVSEGSQRERKTEQPKKSYQTKEFKKREESKVTPKK